MSTCLPGRCPDHRGFPRAAGGAASASPQPPRRGAGGQAPRQQPCRSWGARHHGRQAFSPGHSLCRQCGRGSVESGRPLCQHRQACVIIPDSWEVWELPIVPGCSLLDMDPLDEEGKPGPSSASPSPARDKKIPLRKPSWPLAQDLAGPLLSYGLASQCPAVTRGLCLWGRNKLFYIFDLGWSDCEHSTCSVKPGGGQENGKR